MKRIFAVILLLAAMVSFRVMAQDTPPPPPPPLPPPLPTEPEQTAPSEGSTAEDGTSGDGAVVPAAVAAGPLAGYYRNVIGGKLLLGAAGIVYNEDGEELISWLLGGEGDDKFRLAGGIEFFYNRYLTRSVAFNVGMGFIGKGFKGVDEDDSDYTATVSTLHLQFPVGFVFKLGKVIRLGADLVMSIEANGKVKYDYDGETETEDFDDDWYDYYRRFNIAPRLTFGAGIPIKRVNIIFGASWQMDLLNYFDPEDEPEDFDPQMRYMNIMVHAGAEFSIN